ncbi:hypothetical protein [Bradyrhizobium sp. BR 1432]
MNGSEYIAEFLDRIDSTRAFTLTGSCCVMVDRRINSMDLIP